MKRNSKRDREKGAFDLIEEAVHILRMLPGAIFALYFVGTLPFILGLLYFWADMSRSPFAHQHLAEASLGMALLFLWMKFFQCLFANALRAHITGQPPPRWTFSGCSRIFIIQTLIQPTALIVLPVAVILAGIPLAWSYAYYQNITILTSSETDETRVLMSRSYRQALLWPAQNHVLLMILAGFAFFVFLNLVSVGCALPQLLHILFGIDSVYTQSPMSLLNTTFFAAMFCLTYLCVDPVVKTVYFLRCFYGESLQSGVDLKAELKQFTLSAGQLLTPLLLCLVLLSSSLSVVAEETSSPEPVKQTAPSRPAPNIPPPKLDQTIKKVLDQPKYTWRMPREKVLREEADASKGALGKFLERAAESIKNVLRSVFEWIEGGLNKLFKNRPTSTPKPFSGPSDSLRMFLIALLIVVAVALLILLLWIWKKSHRPIEPVISEPIVIVPDLADENVAADQLPEDAWIKLGRELIERGELRLAMRAFYFASLTHLAARNLITIAKFKSNQDYELELHRRAHSIASLRSFSENVSAFDRTWYGLHEVNSEIVNHFASNVERIKAV